MNTIYTLRYMGLLETLAFKYSNNAGHWGRFEDTFNWKKFEATLDWGKGQ